MVPVSLELPHFDELEEIARKIKVRVSLEGLLQKGAGADFVRELIAFTTQQQMEADIEGLCGAVHGERSN